MCLFIGPNFRNFCFTNTNYFLILLREIIKSYGAFGNICEKRVNLNL